MPLPRLNTKMAFGLKSLWGPGTFSAMCSFPLHWWRGPMKSMADEFVWVPPQPGSGHMFLSPDPMLATHPPCNLLKSNCNSSLLPAAGRQPKLQLW